MPRKQKMSRLERRPWTIEDKEGVSILIIKIESDERIITNH